MAARVFFDTTILVYSAAESDYRTAVSDDLLSAGGHISVQVLNEFVLVALRRLKMPWTEIRKATGDFLALCEPPSPITIDIHDKAVEIAERYRYRIFDALMIASALKSGCSVLYSEDMQGGQKIESLTIRNPFQQN